MTIQVLLTHILNLINVYIIPLLVALAVLALFWGIVKYIWGSGAEGKADGVKIITAGVIGLVVMLSIWGIIAIVGNTLGINNVQNINTPTIR